MNRAIILAAILGVTGTGSAVAQRSCIDVHSTEGWQSVTFDGDLRPVISSIEGGWTVDAQNYAPTGPGGHVGDAGNRLAPFAEYKFDQRFPFGVLLATDGNGYLRPVTESSLMSTRTMRFRINDSDATLGDNAGSMRMCFSAGAASTPFNTPFVEPEAQVQTFAGPGAASSNAGSGVSAACQAERDELDRLAEKYETWRAELNATRRELRRRDKRLRENERVLSYSGGSDPYGIADSAYNYNVSEHNREVRAWERDNDAYDREAEQYNREIETYNRRSAAAKNCR